jgi:hypothetical protein
VFCVPAGGRETIDPADIVKAGDTITILDTPNELGFINWVVAESTGDPLFKSMHYSGSWENQNFLETLSDSTVIRRSYFPILKHQSQTGEPLDVDFSGPEPTIEEKTGDRTEVLNPPPLDRGLAELRDRNEVNMSQDLGVRGLQNTDITGNIQFATVNAQIQLGKSALDPHIRAFERACIMLAKLAFYWVEYSGDTVTSYRVKSKGTKQRGEKINVKPGDFNADTLAIYCELLANTPTDDMQRWNMYAGMLQQGLKIPQSEIVERMELGNPEQLEERFWKEKVRELGHQLFEQQKVMELQQMQIQMQQEAQMQQQAAMQSAAQAQPQGQVPPEEGVSQPAFDQTQGQGFDPSQGGSSPAEAAPQMSQTQTRQNGQ